MNHTSLLVGMSISIALLVIVVMLVRSKLQRDHVRTIVNKARKNQAHAQLPKHGLLLERALQYLPNWKKGDILVNRDGTLRHDPISAFYARKNKPKHASTT